MKMLVTGGTVFVSRRIAEFFCTSGNEVFVLNRNTRAQVPGVQLIQADRHSLVPDSLSGYDFDVVIDVCHTGKKMPVFFLLHWEKILAVNLFL